MNNNVNEKLSRVTVLIPSLNPDEMMVKYIGQLRQAGFSSIVLVDDGSTQECRGYFDEAACEGCTVLRHAVNQGKGRALKTGFHYFLNTFSPDEMSGMVTADADGQHSAEDTVKVALELVEHGGLVLGTRNFKEDTVPFKSRNGNQITTNVFALLYGKRINDTQTGLRGIPYDFVRSCLMLSGERFDYEINMLIAAVREKQTIREMLIRTIYFDSNRATHFSTVRDSVKIYKIMLGGFFRFFLSGILSALVDIGLFALLTKVILKSLDVALATFLGTAVARIISSLFNFAVNKRSVFSDKSPVGRTMLRYYLLCAAQITVSWLSVLLLHKLLDWDTTLIKAGVDLILFFVSYNIQRAWVFTAPKT